MELVSTKFTNLVPLEQFHHKPMVIIHYHRFVMEFLQWHKVCEIGGEEQTPRGGLKVRINLGHFGRHDLAYLEARCSIF